MPRFDFKKHATGRKQIKIDVDGETISAGNFASNQSVPAAMVADRLMVADGGEPVNFPGALHAQVGCVYVMVCVWGGQVCQSCSCR
jgi:hypothetical protein